MRKGSRRFLLLVLVYSVLTAGCAFAGGGPKNVLLVVNDNSAISQSIANYYKMKRRIPDRNVCHIRCSTDELISKAECDANIVAPIQSFLDTKGIHDRIDYIVLTKGIPLKASYNDSVWYGPVSVASILTCVGIPGAANPSINPYGPTAYPLYPTQAFSHQIVFNNGKSYYIVSRLDAYTEAQVRRMIDDSVSCQGRSGLFLLDGRYESDPTSYTGRANDRIRQANDELRAAGFSTYYDSTTFESMIRDFVGGQRNVMGYFGWGSNESSYLLSKYISNYFVPGSIADTYVSTNARSFAYPPTYGQSLMPDLMPQGLSGANGYVSEPDVRYATYPNVLFSRYTAGFNMGESFMAANPRLYWKSCPIGDPLMAPYATPPVISFVSPDDTSGGLVHGPTVLSAEATDASGIKKVEFYVDDNLIATVTAPPYQCVWDASPYPEGSVHSVDVIAYENSPVCTQGMASAQFQVRNVPASVDRISQVMMVPVGTYVELNCKAVIGGTEAFTDGFYMMEEDRSAGIQVLGPFSITTGSIISVSGDIQVVDGQRVIQASSIMDLGPADPGDKAMRPMMMSNRSVANRGSHYSTEYSALAAGLSNTCMLIATAGKVTAAGTNEFAISDGSLDARIQTIKEIKVSLRDMVDPIQMPSLNSYVIVSGVSCYTLEDGLRKPTIRPRHQTDIVQIR